MPNLTRFGVSKSERAFSAVALFLAVLYVAGGLGVWLGIGNPNAYARSLWGFAGLGAGVVILLGVWTQGRSPMVGAFLVFAGTVPLAIVLSWTLLPPVLTAFLALLWARSRWVAARSNRPALSESQ